MHYMFKKFACSAIKVIILTQRHWNEELFNLWKNHKTRDKFTINNTIKQLRKIIKNDNYISLYMFAFFLNLNVGCVYVIIIIIIIITEQYEND